jgi:hypothetical protein
MNLKKIQPWEAIVSAITVDNYLSMSRLIGPIGGSIMNRQNSRSRFSLKVLVTALLFLIPLGLTMASTNYPADIAVNNQLPAAGMTTNIAFEPIELTDMRTVLSKTYDNGDGSYKAVIYVNPIHYQDAEGNWLEIDESQPIPGSRSSSREVDSLQPGPTDGKDTIISDGQNADMNIGGDEAFWFCDNSGTVYFRFRILIKFNVASLGIPSDAQINNAKIMMYYFRSQDGATNEVGASDSISMTSHALTRDWVEGTGLTTQVTQDGATWNDYDGTSSWGSAGGDYQSSPSGSGSTPSAYGWTNLDVTNIAKGWIDGSISNHGAIIIGQSGAHDYLKMFRSSDSASSAQRPKLEIDYVSNYPPKLNKPLPQNRFDMVEDQAITYLDLDGNTRPTTGLFKDDDVGDSLVFYIWTGTTWAGETGGGFDGSLISASIMTNGTLEIDSKKNKFGTEEITLNATDEDGESYEYIVNVKLAAVNDAPKINDTTNWDYDKPEPTVEPGKITCQEDSWVNFTVTAWDPVELNDNPKLKFSVNSTKDYADFFEIEEKTGEVSFLPLNEYVGVYYLKILVDDGNDENNIAEFPFTLEIENVNDAPVFSIIQIDDEDYYIPEGSDEYLLEESAVEDLQFMFWVIVEDEEFDLDDYDEKLKFTITPSTSFELETYQTFPEQVRVTFNPTNDDVGTTSAFLRVEDKEKADTTIELQIEVLNVNDPPEFVRFHYKTQERDIDSTELDLEKLGSGYKATEYNPYVFKIEGMDPDEGDTFKFKVKVLDRDETTGGKMFKVEDVPNNPTTKQITVTPDQQAGREGELNLNITLSDNDNAKSWVVIRIPVDNTNDAPVQPLIDVEINDADKKTRQKENLSVVFEASYTADIVYPDPDGDEDLVYTWDFGDGSDFEYGQEGVVHKFPDSGEYTITLTVTDTEGLSNITEKTIEVVKPKKSSSDRDDSDSGLALGEVSGIPLLYILILIIVIVILIVLFLFMNIRKKKREEEEAAKQQQAQQQAQMAQMQMAQQQYPMAAQYYQDPNMMAQYQAYQEQYQQMMQQQQYPDQYQQQAGAPEQYGYDQTGMGMQQQPQAYTETGIIESQPMQEATMVEGQAGAEAGLPAATEPQQMLLPAEGVTEEGQEQVPADSQEPDIPESPFASAETQTLEEEIGEDAEVAEIPHEPATEPGPDAEVVPEPEVEAEPEVGAGQEAEPEVSGEPEPEVKPEAADEETKAEGEGGAEGGDGSCKNCGAAVKEGWFLCPKCKQPLI